MKGGRIGGQMRVELFGGVGGGKMDDGTTEGLAGERVGCYAD